MKTILFLLSLIPAMAAGAQSFDKYFEDRTLRLDYTFSGTAAEQHIYVDELSASPRWYGRRHHLGLLPVEGNGQLTVCTANTGDTIYRQSFSTLFQEWLNTPEAKRTPKSFENVFLMPFPRERVNVTVTLRDTHRRVIAQATHAVDPTDILIRRTGEDRRTPFVTLQAAADTTNCIHVAFVAEGYREEEMDTYLADARTAVDALFEHEPFKSLRQRFNIVAVLSPSEDTGVSIPRQGVWKHTALGAHFDTFYTERYLTTLHLKTLHDWLTAIPYEHIIILTNTATYGGGGIYHSYNLTAAHHRAFKKVVVHEFGHSFCGLADEYDYGSPDDETSYPTDVEPWEQNVTTLADFGSKWADMLSPGTPVPTPAPDKTAKDSDKKGAKKPGKDGKKKGKQMPAIGVFEGAGYQGHGVYRPAYDCRMKTNEEKDFCPVCQRAISRYIRFYTEP